MERTPQVNSKAISVIITSLPSIHNSNNLNKTVYKQIQKEFIYIRYVFTVQNVVQTSNDMCLTAYDWVNH